MATRLERKTRFELATTTLGRWRSTVELLSHDIYFSKYKRFWQAFYMPTHRLFDFYAFIVLITLIFLFIFVVSFAKRLYR